MKKTLSILSLALVLFACKKSNKSEAQPEEVKHNVTFEVSGFAQEVVGYDKTSSKTSAVGDTLKNYADYLIYRIYNSSGVLVNNIDQMSTAANFGSVSDRLPAGTYSVVIAAAKGYLNASTSGSSLSNSYLWPSGSWNDTFHKKIDLTVGTTDLTQSVRLDRIVGGLEVTLEDAIPTNANKVSIVFQSEAPQLYLATKVNSYTASRTIDFPLTADQKGKTNQKFFAHIGNVSLASTVVIRAYDAANGLISEKTVSNVRCYANQKTLLTGKLFPAATNPSSSFTVFVNPVWGASGTPIPF